ncbi:MAG: hypothetical protein Q8N67_04325 [Candidatus Omnitrophota bacterium]|nr:hypothetical protein [Candidatus Omnitrophota bacterium]
MWRFHELGLGVPERDPHEAEFFHLTEPAEAVVREVIQNSLDAKEQRSGKIKVCFTPRQKAPHVTDWVKSICYRVSVL